MRWLSATCRNNFVAKGQRCEAGWCQLWKSYEDKEFQRAEYCQRLIEVSNRKTFLDFFFCNAEQMTNKESKSMREEVSIGAVSIWDSS